jgi:hypothetical protein
MSESRPSGLSGVARFAGIGMDELIAGQWLSPRVCPHCGHTPDNFVEEETVVE